VLLTEGTPDTVQLLLHKREAELAIVRQLGNGMAGEILVETEYLPVARPAALPVPARAALSDADLRQAIEITIEADGSNAAQAGHGKPAYRSAGR
jgi:hypothetical protein